MVRRVSRTLAILAVAFMGAGTTPGADFDAEGYRAARYRTPVTADPAPAQRIALEDALELDPNHALFLDVMPAEGGIRDPATGAWRLSQQHVTIPGAQWHPETGRAPVEPALWRGLAQAVADYRQKRPEAAVVLFCRIDCWMSWNAARRLARSGVARVYWFAEGADGWHAAGRPLIDARPATIAARNPDYSKEQP